MLMLNGLKKARRYLVKPWCRVAKIPSLNFTTGDFSMVVWILVDDLSADMALFCRGLLDTDGWHAAILMDGSIAFYTNQLGTHQSTLSLVGAITTGIWHLIGFTRSGDTVHTYVDGLDVTATVGAHINPVAANRELHIGMYDGGESPLNGRMWNARIWRGEFSAEEMTERLLTERHLFQCLTRDAIKA